MAVRNTKTVAEAITQTDDPEARVTATDVEALVAQDVTMRHTKTVVEVLVRSARPTAEMHIIGWP